MEVNKDEVDLEVMYITDRFCSRCGQRNEWILKDGAFENGHDCKERRVDRLIMNLLGCKENAEDRLKYMKDMESRALKGTGCRTITELRDKLDISMDH